MSTAIWWCIPAMLLAAMAAAEVAVVDRSGQLSAIKVAEDYLPLRTDLRIPLKGWGRTVGCREARDVEFTRAAGRVIWRGQLEAEPGKRYHVQQVIEETPDAVSLDLQVTAEAEVAIEGVFFFLDVPIRIFSGGQAMMARGELPVRGAIFPPEKAAPRHFLAGEANRLVMVDAGSRRRLEVRLDRVLPTTMQDTREWNGTDYSTYIQLAPALQAGETVGLKITLKAIGQPDRTPAHLTLDTSRTRYRLDGFGGNYCFGIESPVTQHTLENLRIAWARTEMTLAEWEPENDNDDPADTNWAYFESQDTPNSNLRREFLLAKQIQDRGIPYVISIWHLPEWLYDRPGDPWTTFGREVPPEKWTELLECVGSYLLYAKRKYRVEPDLFSFNEPDYGVYVKFTPEQHRDALKSLGAHFRKLGLRTRLLLADVAQPRDSHTYALPSAADPEAMQYVGALAFHSWGGATPEQYAAWGDLAERLGLPLLVTELGVDAGAWRTAAYDTYHYAMREVEMYQQLLLHARPQGTMQWEFTSDYSIVEEREGKLAPTPRFSFVKHFCNLTPPKAEVLTTASDHAKVLFTAFRGDKGTYTLHIANLGADRTTTLAGLPREIRRLRAILTCEGQAFRELEPIAVSAGEVELDLVERSLLTLTTMP